MKNFSDYANIAINRHGLRGVNALARELQIKSSSMSRLNTGKSLPAESTMLKLAELAGLPKEEALIDLNLWRSAKNSNGVAAFSKDDKICFFGRFHLSGKG